MVCYGYHDKIKKYSNFSITLSPKTKKENTAKAINPYQGGVSCNFNTDVLMSGGPDGNRTRVTAVSKRK